MKLLIACSFIVALLCFPGTVASEALISGASLRDLPLGATTTEILIERAATRFGVNEKQFEATLKCESEGFQDIQSNVPKAGGPNGQEDSWGIAQIHLSAWPQITIYEALDVQWAVIWAAQQFAAGHERIWSCYNLLYPKS
jgi:hypothetical protein